MRKDKAILTDRGFRVPLRRLTPHWLLRNLRSCWSEGKQFAFVARLAAKDCPGTSGRGGTRNRSQKGVRRPPNKRGTYPTFRLGKRRGQSGRRERAGPHREAGARSPSSGT